MQRSEPPILLDLFCGAGGAAMGYSRAGFEVIGVDIRPQPHYPFEFILSDWSDPLTILPGLWERDDRPYAIHASPPCQRYSRGTKRWGQAAVDDHPDLVDIVRTALDDIGAPYVLENVPGSPLQNTVTLCGTGFGLRSSERELWRHRLFEVWPEPPLLVPPCAHGGTAKVISVVGGGGGKSKRDTKDGQAFPVKADRLVAMGTPWMNWREVVEAIPPAYTEYLGQHLRRLLDGSWTAVPQDVFAPTIRAGSYRIVGW